MRQLLIPLLALPLLAASCGGQGSGAVSPGAPPPPPITPEGLNLVMRDGSIRLDPRPLRPLYGALVLAEAPDGRRNIPILAAYNPPVGENLRVIVGGPSTTSPSPSSPRGRGSFRSTSGTGSGGTSPRPATAPPSSPWAPPGGPTGSPGTGSG
ncbi:MAG: hypothetical protein RMI36_10585 [Thermus sp.]|uniref:hypothetical protein n=1 Tax=Thermus sp. TaxID=275 RepID=UPI00298F145C|nr:hypothetical protein [Thermus sp.]MDW8018257.1 hypothetical protein [Thermus sp.]